MGKTSIEWTDESTNFIKARRRPGTGASPKSKGGCGSGVGHYCEKVSRGCAGCYASDQQPRFGLPVFHEQRKDPGIETYLDMREIRRVLRKRKPTTFFWCSMSDLFGRWVPDDWIDIAMAMAALTRHHTHKTLTKRADRMRKYLAAPDLPSRIERAARALDQGRFLAYRMWRGSEHLGGWHPRTWRWMEFGVSVEDKDTLWRLEELKAARAATKFVSFEPLLEDLGAVDMTGINQGIVGGESGRKARPFDLAWGVNLLVQMQAQGVGRFMKQCGKVPMIHYGHLWKGAILADKKVEEKIPYETGMVPLLMSKKGGNPEEWPEWMRFREPPQYKEAA